MSAPASAGHGTFQVHIGRRPLDRLVALACGQRRRGAVAVTLDVVPTATGERWQRTIDGRELTTAVRYDDGQMWESRRPVEMRFARTETSGTVTLRLLDARLVAGPLSLPLPRRMLPEITCTVAVTHTDVVIADRRGRVRASYGGDLR